MIRKLSFSVLRRRSLVIMLLICILSYGGSILCVNLTSKSSISPYTLYYKTSSPELSVIKLGLLTTMRLDIERLVFGFDQSDAEDPSLADTATTGSNYSEEDNTGTTAPAPETAAPDSYNVMSIDFAALAQKEKSESLRSMHEYFASVQPTKKNQYTGMFKGNNLILITAESFSPYAIDPKLTPTLYKMAHEGFVFKNFYNPVWGVSTSDGEYVACTGLIPKSGVWSFAKSGANYMPFVMGNQFKALGYPTRAYHDHTYTYYKRNISHPNMGYDYKALGNGLKVTETWPESDIEMIEATAPEYVGSQPFHTYYMTVSGHMNYSFAGNAMAKKNKSYVDGLNYSEPAKAYKACNIELENAMKLLLEKLEAAGAADNTVIAISPDHYPYGLPREAIDELAGHPVENNFELYRSSFILWKKGMEPVTIDKPCSSLDINPTLSNLFGLEYDSRLLMGSDILSDTPPLVIFSNRSWITDKARYNSVTNTAAYTDNSVRDTNYVRTICRVVDNKFKYSAKILDTNYYARVVPKKSK